MDVAALLRRAQLASLGPPIPRYYARGPSIWRMLTAAYPFSNVKSMNLECLTDEGFQASLRRLPESCGGDDPQSAASLLEFVAQALRLDMACLRLEHPPAGIAAEVIGSSAGLPKWKIDALLASVAGKLAPLALLAEGALSIAALPLGCLGVLLAGSRREDFPRPRERLFLLAAANQAAIAHAAQTAKRENSELRESLAAAQAKGRCLKEILDLIPALAWVADRHGRPEFFNQYYLDYVGRTRDEMMGDGWAMNLHPDDLSPLIADWSIIMASRRIGEARARMRRADGEYRWFLFRANPLLDEAGNVVRWYGVNTDIEDHKRVEEMLRNTLSQLAHTTRVLTMGHLTASIAHELNQPLAGIITNAGTCVRMLGADPPNIVGARNTAQRTIRDGNRASEVIERLSALFSKASTASEPVDLNTATHEVIALVLSETQKMNVSIQASLMPDLPPVTGDRVQLQQVILNLIMNAAEAMADVHSRKREIKVSTEREEAGRVRLAVRDVGAGMDRAAVEKAFTPFYTTKASGMGIGLSVSRTIIEHHNGRIWGEPNDGPGSTFMFSLPVRPVDGGAEDQRDQSARL